MYRLQTRNDPQALAGVGGLRFHGNSTEGHHSVNRISRANAPSGGRVIAAGGAADNWGLPAEPYSPPSNWHTAEMVMRQDGWLRSVAREFSYVGLGVATGVLLHSAHPRPISPALSYCLSLESLSVGHSLSLRATLDELAEYGYLTGGRVQL